MNAKWDPAVIARMQMAFDLYETSEAIMRQNLRRRDPEASEEEIERRLRAWLISRPHDQWKSDKRKSDPAPGRGR